MKSKILLIGASGGLAQITSRLILKHKNKVDIFAIDTRSEKYTINNKRYCFEKVAYKRSSFERIFQANTFDAVIFLSRSALSSRDSNLVKQRHMFNIRGTQTILDLCSHFGVKKIVIMSSFHSYGALSDNPAFLSEDDILRASERYPEIRDLVEMDQNCLNWMHTNASQTKTVLLRPVNIIGPNLSNGITKYLTHPFSFYPIDYNPSVQFIHEYDMANILVQSLFNDYHGLFNVAPNNYLSLKDAILTVNPKAIPMLVSALGGVNKLFQRYTGVPDYLVEYLKYPCLLSNKKFNTFYGDDTFKFTTKSALKSLRLKNIRRILQPEA